MSRVTSLTEVEDPKQPVEGNVGFSRKVYIFAIYLPWRSRALLASYIVKNLLLILSHSRLFRISSDFTRHNHNYATILKTVLVTSMHGCALSLSRMPWCGTVCSVLLVCLLVLGLGVFFLTVEGSSIRKNFNGILSTKDHPANHLQHYGKDSSSVDWWLVLQDPGSTR